MSEEVLVTGGGGFLGQVLCRQLIDEGFRVRSYSRSHYPKLEQMGVVCFQGDLNNRKDLEKALSGVVGVFHVASKVGIWGEWEDFYRTNVTGTQTLLEACRSQGVQDIVYTSTPSVVFEWDDIESGDESLPYAKNSKSLYARSKTLAEDFLLKQTDLNICALRPHLIFGPGDPNLIPRLVEKAKKGKLFRVGKGSNRVDVVDVEYAARAHIKAYRELKKGNCRGEAFFIGQGPVYLWDFVDKVLKLYNVPPIKKEIPFGLAYTLGAFFEGLFSLFGIQREPPMTRFVALQLGKSHFFSHRKAIDHLKLDPPPTVDESLAKLKSL